MPDAAPTIGETLRAATARLAAAAILTPRLDAEVLLRHVLRIDRTRLFLQAAEPMPRGATAAYVALIDRRLAGQPVAYLTGTREFLGLPFAVTDAVLIPRPETELLVEWAVRWLSGADRDHAAVVDVGTGSGAIAVGVAALAPPSWGGQMLAIDVSPAALAVARGNAETLAASTGMARLAAIAFREGDLLAGVAGPFDFILANLPYLVPGQIDGNASIAAEPRLALDGGPEGLLLIRRLVDQAESRLAPGGAMALELDPSQAEAVAGLLRGRFPGADVVIHPDLAGLARFVTVERQ